MGAEASQEEGNIKTIIVVDASKEAFRKALELGADHIGNVREIGIMDDEVQKRVIELTDGLGTELTIDAAGFASTCENAIHNCKHDCTMFK